MILLWLCLISIGWSVPNGWEFVSKRDGIEVARKSVQGSDLFAFRGEASLAVPLPVLLSVILADSIGPEWVDLMYISRLIRRKNSTTKIIHQGYRLPWPIQNRDYVLHQQVKYNESTKEVTVLFHSVQDKAVPVQDCCVRAQALRTYWYFKAVDKSNTKAIVEVHTDPKGSLPSWLVNLIQKDWPYNTLSSLLKRSKKGDILPDQVARKWWP